MIERTRRPLTLLGLALWLSGCATASVVPASESPAKTSQVTGTITYRERIALPPAATVNVQLVDVSLADAPAVVLAKQSFQPAGRQVPFAFALDYDPASIQAAHTYAVQVRIEAEGQLLFISDTLHPVLTRDKPAHVDIVVRKVARVSASPTAGIQAQP